MRQHSSSDGQSVEVPSEAAGDSNASAVTQDWRARFEEQGRLDGERGGYGIVVRVVERATGQEFALKYLQSNDAESCARFKREIQQQLRLTRCPHVIRVCAYDEAYGWYTMPLAAGSLTDFGPELSDDEIADVILQMVAALDDAHRIGVVHRDIKPDNILLEPCSIGSRRWFLSDFGAARAPRGLSGGLKTTRAIGTPGFMAPEVRVSPHQDATPAADIYSLGRTLSWLTTGVLPVELQPSSGGGRWGDIVQATTELDMTRRVSLRGLFRSVTDLKKAIRAERRAKWGTANVNTLAWREDRVLWSIVNDGSKDDLFPALRLGAALWRRARREEFRSLDELQVRARWRQRVGDRAIGVA